jgi:radical SAM protein with 4Fe4S-binding SPASM domain
MFEKKHLPFNALYELTLRCNMHCLHCGSSAGDKRVKELATKEWLKVSKDLAEVRCKNITLLGGEPFLRKDWYEISKEIRDYGLKLTIISNGSLINEEIISKLRDLDVYTVAISLDGASSKTHDNIRQISGSFEKCKQVISMLKEAEINTSVITTLNKINFEDLPSLRDFLLGKGIAWQLQFAAPIGRFPRELILSKEEFYSAAMFIEISRKKFGTKQIPVAGAHCFGYHSKYLRNINIVPIWKGCQAGLTILGIQSNGCVKGCLSLDDEYIDGNVLKNNIKDIWNRSDFAKYNRKFKKEQLGENCKECKYGKSCKGGCMSVSTSLTGSAHNDPYCFKLIEDSPDFSKIKNI